MAIEVFRSKETKYLMTKKQYEELYELIKDRLEKDKYYKSKICNIYFDTDNYDLIVKSLEKPFYKEKVRLRSYDIPDQDSIVFLEIKKKYEGIVGKRRIEMRLRDFYSYLESGELKNVSKQISKEIDYCFKYYNLKPKLFLAYDRLSYYDKDNINFRITIDKNIRSREDNLRLEFGDKGKLYFDEEMYMMETKALNAYPIWFSKILSKLKIYPISFSKYGNIYQDKLKESDVYV
jgi:SPX domain protein involved in polyphosphate accumulation